MGPTQPLIQLVSAALSPGVKRWKREVDHCPTFSAENMRGAVGPLPVCTGAAFAQLSYLSLCQPFEA